ncbi:hypothetical protein [Peterkaempfera sp. SMS 1(5)a]|uniref:hypothetical protein n=1 Tax=Peterkaempfera podocarpi TaxID=3232308 RepID=UPI00366E2521
MAVQVLALVDAGAARGGLHQAAEAAALLVGVALGLGLEVGVPVGLAGLLPEVGDALRFQAQQLAGLGVVVLLDHRVPEDCLRAFREGAEGGRHGGGGLDGVRVGAAVRCADGGAVQPVGEVGGEVGPTPVGGPGGC